MARGLKQMRMIKDGITIAMPAYNESGAIARTAELALAALDGAAPDSGELLIVDDGSEDATGEIADAFAAKDSRVRVFRHERNMGFAAAQRSCYLQASREWVFLLPADGQVAPSEINEFLPHCGRADLMLGVARRAPEKGLRKANSALYHRIVRAMFSLPPGDFGACLMARRSLAAEMKSVCRTPVAMTELAARAVASGAKVIVVPVEKKPRIHGKARGGDMIWLAPSVAAELAALFLELKTGIDLTGK